MQLAICIHNKATIMLLSKLFAEYEQQRSVTLRYRIFDTDLALLCDLIPGEYDAIFCGGAESRTLIDDLYKHDAGVQLVRIFSIDANGEDIGQGYCLPAPVSALFLFPVLDKLFLEMRRGQEAKMLVKKRGSMMYLTFSQIEYVEVCSRVVLFYLVDGRVEEGTGIFADYEEKMLQWPDFVKVHRSYIVNLHCVEKLLTDSLLTKNGHVVPISKLVYPQFKRDYLSGISVKALKPEPPTSPPEPKERENTCRILLVDDEADELDRWSERLIGKGCAVFTASTGENAVALAEEYRFDCVLLDVQLGSSSGFNLCNMLTEKTGAPVLFLSTLCDTEHQMQGFLTGGADYLTKDTPPELIWLKIERRIEASKTAKPELISGALRVNMRMHQAFITEQALPLTSVEFDLLCLLMQNPNTTYTPERLYRLIWGARQWDDGHTVQMHMTLLCNKLTQRYPMHNFIDSVWGDGYRFSPER